VGATRWELIGVEASLPRAEEDGAFVRARSSIGLRAWVGVSSSELFMPTSPSPPPLPPSVLSVIVPSRGMKSLADRNRRVSELVRALVSSSASVPVCHRTFGLLLRPSACGCLDESEGEGDSAGRSVPCARLRLWSRDRDPACADFGRSRLEEVFEEDFMWREREDGVVAVDAAVRVRLDAWDPLMFVEGAGLRVGEDDDVACVSDRARRCAGRRACAWPAAVRAPAAIACSLAACTWTFAAAVAANPARSAPSSLWCICTASARDLG